jgi:hypothetical protein
VGRGRDDRDEVAPGPLFQPLCVAVFVWAGPLFEPLGVTVGLLALSFKESSGAPIPVVPVSPEVSFFTFTFNPPLALDAVVFVDFASNIALVITKRGRRSTPVFVEFDVVLLVFSPDSVLFPSADGALSVLCECVSECEEIVGGVDGCEGFIPAV